MTPETYQILATWDAESGVWVASSDDVPGLVTEAESLEALEFKLQTMVPELLEINGRPQSSAGIRIQLIRKMSGGGR